MALPEKKDLIHRLQIELEKANERVSILSLKCEECSKENQKLKVEHANAIKDRDHQSKLLKRIRLMTSYLSSGSNYLKWVVRKSGVIRFSLSR